MTSVICLARLDPITNRHLDIIARSAVIFLKVLSRLRIVRVKEPLFSLEERGELVRQSVAPHLSNVWKYLDSLIYWRDEIKVKKNYRHYSWRAVQRREFGI